MPAIAVSLIVLTMVTGCSTTKHAESSILRQVLGQLEKDVHIYTLENKNGMRARITNYGGIIVSLEVPDRKGKLGDVVLGYDTLEQYVEANPYFGALIGRYGNRIAKGRFTLNGKVYELAINNNENHLHGGIVGFDKVVWKADPITSRDEGPVLALTHTSVDGDEGYPGNLSMKIIYTLTENNELRIDYYATTDQDTVVNLTQHSYFNLAGAGSGTILDHIVTIDADKFTPVDSGLIPTGELRPVGGTPFDFRDPTAIGARIEEDNEQLEFGGGYDHNWCLNTDGLDSPAASVYEPTTGRYMEVFTTEPGVQFYVGNFLNGTNVGKGGIPYEQRTGFCLETQHYPDSPNQPNFPSVVLKKGGKYKQTTIYRFSTIDD